MVHSTLYNTYYKIAKTILVKEKDIENYVKQMVQDHQKYMK